jgi:HPt (histidine-containing phosphotransfer) domain-containing protein
MSSVDDFGTSQKVFRRMFLERLAKDEVAVIQALDDVHGGDGSAAERIFRLAHGLAGASGIFGFADIGELAQQVEICADAVRHGDSGRLADLQSHARNLLKRMRETLTGSCAS